VLDHRRVPVLPPGESQHRGVEQTLVEDAYHIDHGLEA
jgi:hypothetical protein